jgi:hypothetical protein
LLSSRYFEIQSCVLSFCLDVMLYAWDSLNTNWRFSCDGFKSERIDKKCRRKRWSNFNCQFLQSLLNLLLFPRRNMMSIKEAWERILPR